MAETRIDLKELDRKIKCLFPMPQTLVKILDVLNNPDGNIIQLENHLKSDPDFSVKLLSLANSAFYGFPHKVTSVHKAITLLGFNTIKNLAVQMNVSQAFKNQNDIPGFSSEDLLKHSVGVAVCARMLAKRLRMEETEELFTMGVLHDMGLLIEQRFFPELVAAVLSRVHEQDELLPEIEQKLLGVHHARITKLLCEKWSLPDKLSIPLAFHHSPWETIKDYQRSAGAIYLADKMAMEAGYGFSYPRVGEQDDVVLSLLKLEGSDLEFLYDNFQSEADIFLGFLNQL